MMGKVNLMSKEAIDKLKELVNNIDFAMMETNLGGKPAHIIPMSTKKVDKNGNIWFLSNKNSNHNSNIEQDNAVQLIYSKASDMEFLTVFGTASIITDQAVINELYGKMDDIWFEGKDDPNVTAIVVDPKDCYYWDTKNGKLVTLFKMGVGVVTGERQDVGEYGKLEV